MNRNPWRPLPLVLIAALSLQGCAPKIVRESAPSIRKSVGKLDEPSPEVLPIIASEPVAIDPERAAENYRRLLELAPDPETRSEAQRRLADLQVQMQDAKGTGDESEATLQNSIKLYNELLYAHPNDKDNDRIFYQLARAQQNIGDPEAAIDTLERLTQRHPDSPLAGDAHFRRAELLFNLRRYAEAEGEYRIVMDLGDATQFFEAAQYKYGWSQYKQSKYDEAITTFFDVLDRELPAEGTTIDTAAALQSIAPAKVDLVRDSLRVITLSLATLGGGPALSEYLQTHGDPRFYPLVYAALGESLLDKRRYSDAATAYAAFIERYPSSEFAPAFQSRVIAVYDEGGFGDLVLREKERYAKTYDPAAAYWNGTAPTEAVMTELRGHLEDLAKYYHAEAQQAKTAKAESFDPAAFLVAAGWYRRIIDLYPGDPGLPEINFLLGDSLLDGGHTLEAAQEYDRTAYGYPNYPRAGEAAYASVLAYQQHAKAVAPDQRPQNLRTAIDASVKLADHFDGHPQKYPVLTQAAQDLFELKAYDEAVTVGGRVLESPTPVDATLRRVAWSVVGDSHFAQQRYAPAEKAYAEELKLTAADTPEHAEVTEQLAASIYKQGEVARAAGELRTAAQHFLRVGQITPTSKIRATAEYDGAAALIELEDWPEAATVLERFRSLFPGHELEADVDKKLAVVYQKDDKPAQAAEAYARIARRDSESVDIRREAAWLSATLYEQANAADNAATAFEYYVTQFPRPLPRAIEARVRLVDHARVTGDRDGLAKWLRELVSADDTAGQERTPQSRSLAAQSSLELGRMAADDARAIPLTLPIERNLPRKKQAMEDAIRWLGKASSFGFAETTTAATDELGRVYQDFGKALLKSERPRNLSGLELEQYDLLLEEQAYPFEEQAIEAYEANLKRIPQGLYDQWIARSAEALAQIAPARYGKIEHGEDRYESLN